MSRVSLTMTEAERVCRHAFEKAAGPREDYDEHVTAQGKAQAALGAFYIVEALQDMGYRIAAPLVLAHKEAPKYPVSVCMACGTPHTTPNTPCPSGDGGSLSENSKQGESNEPR